MAVLLDLAAAEATPAARRLERSLTRAVGRVRRQLVARLRAAADADRALTSATLPPELLLDDSLWELALIEEHVVPHLWDVMRTGADAVGLLGPGWFGLHHSAAVRSLGEQMRALLHWTQTLRNIVGTATETAARYGWSIDQLAEEIDALDALGENLGARRIARTELPATLNAGFAAMVRATGMTGQMVWNATDDARTRPTHAAADGQTAPVGGLFVIGGHEARRPGDPRLPVHERVNCRCVLTFQPDEDPDEPTVDLRPPPGGQRAHDRAVISALETRLLQRRIPDDLDAGAILAEAELIIAEVVTPDATIDDIRRAAHQILDRMGLVAAYNPTQPRDGRGRWSDGGGGGAAIATPAAELAALAQIDQIDAGGGDDGTGDSSLLYRQYLATDQAKRIIQTLTDQPDVDVDALLDSLGTTASDAYPPPRTMALRAVVDEAIVGTSSAARAAVVTLDRHFLPNDATPARRPGTADRSARPVLDSEPETAIGGLDDRWGNRILAGDRAARIAKKRVVADVADDVLADPDLADMLTESLYGHSPERLRVAVEDRVQTTLDAWATSSMSDASQRFAAIVDAEFGLGAAASLADRHGRNRSNTELLRDTEVAWGQRPDGTPRALALDRAIARSMYARTQSALAAQGITEVAVHRGMGLDPHRAGATLIAPAVRAAYAERHPERLRGFVAAYYRSAPGAQRPLSSWTTRAQIAHRFSGPFAADGAAVVQSAVVPAAAVFSMPGTGLGSYAEAELVLLPLAEGAIESRFAMTAETVAAFDQLVASAEPEPDWFDPDWIRRAPAELTAAYNPNQARDGRGRWSAGGGYAEGLATLSAGWETTRPWDASRDAVAAGEIPGIRLGRARRSGHMASEANGTVTVTDNFFDQPTGLRRAILYHEAGHAITEQLGGGVAAADAVASAFGVGDAFDVVNIEVRSADGTGTVRLGDSLGGDYEEVVAEGYAALWSDPDWYVNHDAGAVRSAIETLAADARFPLPAATLVAAYNPNQPRDGKGRWSSGGGGGGEGGDDGYDVDGYSAETRRLQAESAAFIDDAFRRVDAISERRRQAWAAVPKEADVFGDWPTPEGIETYRQTLTDLDAELGEIRARIDHYNGLGVGNYTRDNLLIRTIAHDRPALAAERARLAEFDAYRRKLATKDGYDETIASGEYLDPGGTDYPGAFRDLDGDGADVPAFTMLALADRAHYPTGPISEDDGPITLRPVSAAAAAEGTAALRQAMRRYDAPFGAKIAKARLVLDLGDEAWRRSGMTHSRASWRELADQIQGEWSTSSMTDVSQAFQAAVAVELGLDAKVDVGAYSGYRRRSNAELLDEWNGDGGDTERLRTLARVTYDLTQTRLASLGVTAVEAHRGMSWSTNYGEDVASVAPRLPAELFARRKPGTTAKDEPGAPFLHTGGYRWSEQDVALEQRPLASWSYEQRVAAAFSGPLTAPETGPGHVKVRQSTVVPAAAVFSMPTTGPGAMREQELVLLPTPWGSQADWFAMPSYELEAKANAARTASALADPIGFDPDWIRRPPAAELTAAYNPTQARDERGRWTSGGGGLPALPELGDMPTSSADDAAAWAKQALDATAATLDAAWAAALTKPDRFGLWFADGETRQALHRLHEDAAARFDDISLALTSGRAGVSGNLRSTVQAMTRRASQIHRSARNLDEVDEFRQSILTPSGYLAALDVTDYDGNLRLVGPPQAWANVEQADAKAANPTTLDVLVIADQMHFPLGEIRPSTGPVDLTGRPAPGAADRDRPRLVDTLGRYADTKLGPMVAKRRLMADIGAEAHRRNPRLTAREWADIADNIQAGWAESSMSERSQAFQAAVAAELGLSATASLHDRTGANRSNDRILDQWDQEMGPRTGAYSGHLRTVARVTYDITQTRLATDGVAALSVQRGMKWQAPPTAVTTRIPAAAFQSDSRYSWQEAGAALERRPLSSWTANGATARAFARDILTEGSASAVETVTVPAAAVFSMPTTGPGAAREWETVLLPVAASDLVEWTVTPSARLRDQWQATTGLTAAVSLPPIPWDPDWIRKLGDDPVVAAYNPNQTRDGRGRWTSGGGGFPALPELSPMPGNAEAAAAWADREIEVANATLDAGWRAALTKPDPFGLWVDGPGLAALNRLHQDVARRYGDVYDTLVASGLVSADIGTRQGWARRRQVETRRRSRDLDATNTLRRRVLTRDGYLDALDEPGGEDQRMVGPQEAWSGIARPSEDSPSTGRPTKLEVLAAADAIHFPTGEIRRSAGPVTFDDARPGPPDVDIDTVIGHYSRTALGAQVAKTRLTHEVGAELHRRHPDRPYGAWAEIVDAAQLSWADSSMSPTSQAFQAAVAAELGVDAAVAVGNWRSTPRANQQLLDDWDRDGSAELVGASAAELRQVARASYDITQARLATAGVTAVSTHRGMNWDGARRAPDDVIARIPAIALDHTRTGFVYPKGHTWTETDVAIERRPLASWTASTKVARDFADTNNLSGRVRVIESTTVPAAAVFSIPSTGLGAGHESELVLLPTSSSERAEWQVWPSMALQERWEAVTGLTAAASLPPIPWDPDWIRRAPAELTASADDDHGDSSMIALRPRGADRLAAPIEGAEVPEQLHVTVVYLGDDPVPAEKRAELNAVAMRLLGASWEVPVAEVAELGHDDDHRCVALVLDVPPKLAAAQKLLQRAAVDLGFPPSRWPTWLAHITLGYARHVADWDALWAYAESLVGTTVVLDTYWGAYGSDDAVAPLVAAYNPTQARDGRGRWTSGGAGGTLDAEGALAVIGAIPPEGSAVEVSAAENIRWRDLDTVLSRQVDDSYRRWEAHYPGALTSAQTDTDIDYALRSYRDQGYIYINQQMRLDDDLHGDAAAIEAYFADPPPNALTTEPYLALRGVSVDAFPSRAVPEPGDRYVDLAPSSVTFSADTAINFATGARSTLADAVFLRMQLPEGTPVAFGVADEAEMIVAPRIPFRVTATTEVTLPPVDDDYGQPRTITVVDMVAEPDARPGRDVAMDWLYAGPDRNRTEITASAAARGADARFIAVPADLVAHLPGRHDQKSHGRRARGGKPPMTNAERALLAAADAGGFTYNPLSGRQPTEGFAVAAPGHSQVIHGYSGRSDAEKLTAVRSYVGANIETALADPELHIGGWHDTSDDTFWLDLSQVLPPTPDGRAEAIRRGRERNERSIADLAAIAAGDFDNAFIDTGGTGNDPGLSAAAGTVSGHGHRGDAQADHGADRRHRPGGAGGPAAARRRGGPDRPADVRGDRGPRARRLAADAKRAAASAFAYNPNQPRDGRGRWSSGGGSSGGGGDDATPARSEAQAAVAALRSRIAEAVEGAPLRPAIVSGFDLAEWEAADKRVGNALKLKSAAEAMAADAKASGRELTDDENAWVTGAADELTAAIDARNEITIRQADQRRMKIPDPAALEGIGAMIRAERNRRSAEASERLDGARAEFTAERRRIADDPNLTSAEKAAALDVALGTYMVQVELTRARLGADLLDVVNDIRPLGPDGHVFIGQHAGVGGPLLNAAADHALRHYPTDWIERRKTEGLPQLATGEDTGMANALGTYNDKGGASFQWVPTLHRDDATGTWRAAERPQAGIAPGQITVRYGVIEGVESRGEAARSTTGPLDRILTHELGHAFGQRRQGIRDAERDYMEARGYDLTSPVLAEDRLLGEDYFVGGDIASGYTARAYYRPDGLGHDWAPLEVFTTGMEAAFYPGGPNSRDTRLGDWALGVLVTM